MTKAERIQKTIQLVVKYQTYIANVQWNIDTNGDIKTAQEIHRMKERISDYKEMIDELKKLL